MSRQPQGTPKRVSVSVRISETTAKRLRDFVRYHAGHPLYLELGAFVEDAVLAHIQRAELMLSGAIPLDEQSPRGERPSAPLNNHRT